MPIKVTNLTVNKTILFNSEPYVAVSVIVSNAGLIADADGKKILKAGTPLYGSLIDRATAFAKATPIAESAGSFTKANGAYSQVVADGTAEVVSLKVTHIADAAGNLTITLGESTAVTIAVLQNDTAAAIATKIAAGTFPGYTAAVDAGNTDTVIFTASEAGYKPAAAVGYAATGVTGTITEVTKGGSNTVTLPVAANSNAVGLLLHEVDVTSGNENATLLISGMVDYNKVIDVITVPNFAGVAAALKNITFVA